jgi:hypothetical protein
MLLVQHPMSAKGRALMMLSLQHLTFARDKALTMPLL